MTKTCPTCGHVFERAYGRSDAQWEKATFCSNACRGISLTIERAICACGCGGRVAKAQSRYRPGHNPPRRGGTITLWATKGRKSRWTFRDRQGHTVYYARAVMAAHIHRDLLPGEVVDHENGDSLDDRIENLRLYPSHSEHMRVEYQRGRLPAMN